MKNKKIVENEWFFQELRNELEKRQLDKNGIKIILSVRLEKVRSF